MAAKHKLTLLGATSYIVGTMIGSGIFVSPKGIIQHTGSVGLSLIIWFLCAVLAAITALSYIELGTSIPESGSEFAYITYIGWTPIAFSFLWLATIVQSSCSGAVLFKTFGKYVVASLSNIPGFPTNYNYFFQEVFGISLMVILTFINCYSLRKYAAKLQIVSMFAKVIVLLLITVIGVVWLAKGYTENLVPPKSFEGSKWSPAEIVLAIYQGNWAYNGFSTLNYGTDEIDPKGLGRVLTCAVIGGITISSVVYLLANVAYFSVLSSQNIIASNAVATTFIEHTLGLQFSYMMPALVGLLLIGTLNGHLFTWSRFMRAGSQKNMMPTAFSLIHPKHHSPRIALFVHTFSAIVFSFFGDVNILVDWLTVTGTLCTIFAFIALILIKVKNIPISENAVRFHIIWVILGLILNICIFIIPIIQEPAAAAIGIGFFVGGIGCYFLLQNVTTKQKIWLQKIDHVSTKWCQRIFEVVLDQTEIVLKSSGRAIIQPEEKNSAV